MYAQFRMSLSKALSEATGHFDIVTSDTRIGPLLKVLTGSCYYVFYSHLLFVFLYELFSQYDEQQFLYLYFSYTLCSALSLFPHFSRT